MARTVLERHTRAVLECLRACDGSSRERRRRLGAVLETLALARPAERLATLAEAGGARGLAAALKQLVYVLQSACELPEALATRYVYHASEAHARSHYRVPRGEWTFFHSLAAEADWDPALHLPRLDYSGSPWHDALEEKYVDVEVVLAADALETMVICAMEGYLSPRSRRRKGYEVYGVNFGMVREVAGRTGRSGRRSTRYVSVMRAQPQLSAESAFGFVEPNPRSLAAILTAGRVFYPHHQAVGDFHSHPFDDLAALRENRGWMFTREDERANMEFASAMAELGHRIEVALVVCIARGGKAPAGQHFRGEKNTFQLAVDHCRVVVVGYRSLGSGRLSRVNTRLCIAGRGG